MKKIIDSNTFSTEVLSSNLPVLVNFSAAWCGPCRSISPIIEKLTEDYKEKVKIVKLDIEMMHDVSRDFNIRGVPTFIFFKDGKEIERWVGANKSEKEFRDKLDSL